MPLGEAFSAKARIMMKYRNVEYTVVQGIERGVWKWWTLIDGMMIRGQAAIKSDAVAAAEKAIDRALAAKRCSSFRRKATIDRGDCITI
jgi:hypothetical protein